MRKPDGRWPILRSARRFASFRLVVASWLVVATLPLPTAHAQQTAPAAASAGDSQSQLKSTQESLEASVAKRKAIEAEIGGIKDDHVKLTATLIEATKHVSEDEQKIGDGQARLDKLNDDESVLKHSLEGRRALIAEVLASLQRMGRKPPPALLVDPSDILKAIRTSMLLGAVVPGMRAQIDVLIGDLTELARVRAAIEAERQTLTADLSSIKSERQRLSALVEARQAALGKAQNALEAERSHAQALAEQATSLKELIARMESGSKPAADAAEAARKADAQRQSVAALSPDPSLRGTTAPFKDSARLAPAVAFASLKGQVPLPVSGTVLRGFGSPDGFGGTGKGTSFKTGAGAIVASPSDGWIAYAGPYRSFGQLLIINAGSGYYIVLAGMDRINVDLGQFVLAGEPVAVMGDGSVKTAASVALGAAQPVLYVEFRKDGATIDPGPWWAKPELQKVRG